MFKKLNIARDKEYEPHLLVSEKIKTTFIKEKITGVWFLLMYLRKDAAASSQIEGTVATMVNAKVTKRREIDMQKIEMVGKRAGESAAPVL